MYRALFLFIVSCFLSLFTFSQSNNGLDPTFADSGRVRTYLPAFGFHWGEQFSAQQDDEKIITARQFMYDLIITRHTQDGLLDYTWGNTGYVNLDTTLGIFTASSFLTLGDLRIQDNGKVLIVGSIVGSPGDPHQEVVIRLNPDGSLDNSFDGDGIRTTSYSAASIWGVIGACVSENRLLVFHTDQQNHFQSFIKAYKLSDGSDDIAWGNGGEIIFDYDMQSTIQQVTVQEDGKILLTGINKMIRFLPNGSLDAQFAQNGKIVFDYIGQDSVSGALKPRNRFGFQSDKSIVISGLGNSTTAYDEKYVMRRLDSNGVIDNSFGNNGMTVIDHETNAGFITQKDLVIQPDDGIVLLYEFKTENGNLASTQRHFALKRFHADGTVDSSFGNNGIIITTNFYEEYPSYDYVCDAFTNDDGKIVAVGLTFLGHPGYTYPPSELYDVNVLTMARYLPYGGFSNIEETKSNGGFNVYPNPAHDRINVAFESNTFSKKVQLEVYSINGKMIHEESGNSNTINSIDISELSSGVYILKIQQGEIVSRQKFVKQ